MKSLMSNNARTTRGKICIMMAYGKQLTEWIVIRMLSRSDSLDNHVDMSCGWLGKRLLGSVCEIKSSIRRHRRLARNDLRLRLYRIRHREHDRDVNPGHQPPPGPQPRVPDWLRPRAFGTHCLRWRLSGGPLFTRIPK